MNYLIVFYITQENTPLSDIVMSARLRRALRRMEVQTLSDLRQISGDQLRQKRFTKTEIKELKDILELDYNLFTAG